MRGRYWVSAKGKILSEGSVSAKGKILSEGSVLGQCQGKDIE